MATRRPRRGVRIVALCTSTLVALLLGEGVARLVVPKPPLVRFAKAGSANPEGEGLYQPRPNGAIRLRPGADLIIENHRLSKRDIRIQVNSLGYRNRELSPTFEGERILFLGDSVTLADYLPEQDTFVRMIERLARERGATWETVNAGVGGISLATEVAILEESGLSVKPTTVVLAFYLNDYDESIYFNKTEFPRVLKNLRLAWVIAGLFRTRFGDAQVVDRRLAAWKAEFERAGELGSQRPGKDASTFREAVLATFRDWGGSFSPHAWERMAPHFERLKLLSKEHGFRLLFAALPVRSQVEADGIYDYPQSKLKEIGAAAGVPVLDLLAAFRAAFADGQTLFYDQCHHTPEGAVVVAKELSAFLEEQLGK